MPQFDTLPPLPLTLAIDWAAIGSTLGVVVFLLACLVLILVVLIQKPQGGGLAGAFGAGAGSGQTAFGARTGDALTIATIGFFLIYVLLAIGLNYVVVAPTAIAPPTETPPAETTTDPAAPAAPGSTAPATPAPSGASPAPAPAATPAPGEPTLVPPAPTPAPAPAP